MAKVSVGRLAAPALLALTLVAAAPRPAAPLIDIVRLEQSRSLGHGVLAGLLLGRDRLLAVRAALAIGRTKQPAGLALLAKRRTTRDAALRAMVVYAEGLIGTRAAAPSTLAALRDPTAVVEIAALDAADRLGTAQSFTHAERSAAAVRVRSLLRSRSTIVRARAATTLEVFQSSPEAAACVRALSSAFAREADPFVRWHIMWTLYRAYAASAPNATLLRGLRDRDEVVRIEAVRAIGRRGRRGDAGLLQPLTRDRSWRVQEQALESLKLLRGGTLSAHLKTIPSIVHTPAPAPDRFAGLAALPRSAARTLRPRRPQAAFIERRPTLNPETAGLFTGPAAGPHPRVRIVTTKGNVYVMLYPEWAPLTVENFLRLANRGYYDNNPWFRIVPDFVVQTGDPTGNGNGDAGYTIPAEENPIEQDSYVISMGMNYTNPPNAHAIRDSAGTQFYITLSPQLHLDRDFTVFGRVIGGSDVLGRLVERDKIVRVDRIPDGGP